jgi:hypothetical protein
MGNLVFTKAIKFIGEVVMLSSTPILHMITRCSEIVK